MGNLKNKPVAPAESDIRILLQMLGRPIGAAFYFMSMEKQIREKKFKAWDKALRRTFKKINNAK